MTDQTEFNIQRHTRKKKQEEQTQLQHTDAYNIVHLYIILWDVNGLRARAIRCACI